MRRSTRVSLLSTTANHNPIASPSWRLRARDRSAPRCEVTEEIVKPRRPAKPADVGKGPLREVRAELSYELRLAVAETIDDHAIHRDQRSERIPGRRRQCADLIAKQIGDVLEQCDDFAPRAVI